MLEAIAALEGVNPDITFSDSAALVPTEGAAEGVGVTAAIGTAARSCLDLAYGAASCCASAAFSCCSAAVSYVSDACTCFFGVLPNGAAKTAVDATSSADVAAASETSNPGENGATAELGAAGTEAGGVDELQPFPPSEGGGDEYCETPTKEPAAAATEEPAAALVATGDVAEGRDRAQAETEAGAGRLLCLPATARRDAPRWVCVSNRHGAPATATPVARSPRAAAARRRRRRAPDVVHGVDVRWAAPDELQCPVLGQCVEVLWDDDGKYYRCMFTAFDGKEVTILYDTGDEETVALAGLVYNPLDSQADVDGAASPSSEESHEPFRLLTKDEKYGPQNRKEEEELAKIQQKLESFLNDEGYLLDDLDGFTCGLLFHGRPVLNTVHQAGGRHVV